MGDPDLRPGEGERPRRGLVVFPVSSLAPRSAPARAGWLGDWAIVLVALVVGGAVIAIALIVR